MVHQLTVHIINNRKSIDKFEEDDKYILNYARAVFFIFPYIFLNTYTYTNLSYLYNDTILFSKKVNFKKERKFFLLRLESFRLVYEPSVL